MNKTSWSEFLCFLTLISLLHKHSVVRCVPPPTDDGLGEGLVSSRYKRDDGDEATFTSRWVTQCGHRRDKPSGTDALKVISTGDVSEEAHEKASRLVFLMLRFIPKSHFSLISRSAIIGVFGRNQTLSVLPPLAKLRDRPDCKGNCSDSCRWTCSRDGRKYDSLPGLMFANTVAIREDLIMCDVMKDPYGGKMNILLHELSHGVMRKAMPVEYRNRVRYLFREIKHLFRPDTYAMSNSDEFWAGASEAFFATNKRTSKSSGLNLCGEKVACASEWSSRENLRSMSTKLYDLLVDVYTDNRTYAEGRIGTCTW